MKTEELNEVLWLHKLWLNGEPGGKKAYLSGANLSRVNLSGAKYNPFTLITQINMPGISDELTLELMRQDALICGKDKMAEWAKGGECPFSGLNQIRAFRFREKKELWKSGKPKMNMMEIFTQYCKEAGIKI